MSEEIIEPSEIIIEKNGTVKDAAVRGNPWIRFLARLTDYALFLFVLLALRYLFKTPPFIHYESWVPLPPLAWIPLEALLLSTWGTTPGKFFLKIKIVLKRGGKLDYMTALRRSFNVWFRGLGLGIYIIAIFCLMIAYQRFKLLSTTSWDLEAQTIVTHYPIGRWRVVLASLIAFAGFVLYTRYI